MSETYCTKTKDQQLVEIFDNLLLEFADKNADIVRSQLASANLLTLDDCSLINSTILSNDKWRTIFSLLKSKEAEEFIFTKLQEICVTQKWRHTLKKIRSKLKSINATDYLINSHQLQQIHNCFTFGQPKSTEIFVGREGQLVDLYWLLNQEEYNSETEKNSASSANAVLTGLAGVGKTQLVVKYTKENCFDFDSIVWINLESQQSAADCFISLAKNLKVSTIDVKAMDTVVPAVYKKLSEIASKNLVIFDNADSRFLEEFMPSNYAGFSVIIISRNQYWPCMSKLKLEAFDDAEAIDFIKKSLQSENYASQEEVETLATRLHNYPLALQLAVDYIRQSHVEESLFANRFTISDYLKEYDIYAKNLLDYKCVTERNNLSLIATSNVCTVTFEKLKNLTYRADIISVNQNNNNETLQIKILNLIAYMSNENIDQDIFLDIAFGDKKHLGVAVSKLEKYGMVQVSTVIENNRKAKCSFLNVHKLVQQVTRLRLEEACQEEQIFQLMLKILDEKLQAFNYNYQTENFSKIRGLLPHLVVLKSEIENWGRKNPSIIQAQKDYLYNILRVLHIGYNQIGDSVQEKTCLLQLILIQYRFLGFGNLHIAKTLSNLGNTISDLGHPKTAIILFQRVLKIEELNYDAGHYELAGTLINLANAYGRLGNLKRKHMFLERALKIQENHFGPEHFEVVVTLTNLATTYGELGNPKMQKALLEKALSIKENHYGPDHLQVAITSGNLANVHGILGDYKTQVELLEKALKIYKNHHSSDHIVISTTLENLAIAHGYLDDSKTKKMLLEKALKIKKIFYGSDGIEIAVTLTNLALAFGSLGDSKMQKELLEKALEITEKHYGSDHFEVAIILVNLSNVYDVLGDPIKQKMLLERALQINKKYYGPDHYEVAKTLALLANAYKRLKDNKTNHILLERALKILQNTNCDNFETMKFVIKSALSGNDISKQTLELLEKFLTIVKHRFPQDHSLICSLLESIKKLSNSNLKSEFITKSFLVG